MSHLFVLTAATRIYELLVNESLHVWLCSHKFNWSVCFTLGVSPKQQFEEFYQSSCSVHKLANPP